MTEFEKYIERKKHQYGAKFDPSDLHEQFVHWYNTGQRIRVRRVYEPNGVEFIRTGRVGVTTGWKPAFLLMHRSNDLGSSDILSIDDVVTHVNTGRKYEELVNGR